MHELSRENDWRDCVLHIVQLQQPCLLTIQTQKAADFKKLNKSVFV